MSVEFQIAFGLIRVWVTGSGTSQWIEPDGSWHTLDGTWCEVRGIQQDPFLPTIQVRLVGGATGAVALAPAA